MRERRSVWLAMALAGLVDRAASANTFEMLWSTQSYGPDGPWQAVQVKIGSSDAVVNLYPGGTWGSHILTPAICSNASLGSICYAQTAGLYDPKFSETASFGDISISADADFTSGALQIFGPKPVTGTDNWDITNNDNAMYPVGINMALHSSLWATLPDGSTYPVSLGNLALGAPNTINQTFTTSSGPSINATLLPGYLSTEAPANKILSSNSYGLHIGSVSPPITPSLYFGGYDQNRALGTISTQQGYADAAGAIDLLDINLNVQSGESPWSFKQLDGLLASGNDSIKTQLPVGINALAPYLHLPKSTCDAIASHLPVTFQPKYGLYFWDVEDPLYEKIVTSPSSIGFTFRVSESSKKFTINVPFALLNLTLTAPLTTSPTKYFPCKAEEQTYYQLGRSFLQAAFIGANWNGFNGSAAWWLAQAPGPSTPSQVSIQAIGDSDTSIGSSEVDWASTWADTWKPLTKSATQSGDPSPSSTADPQSTNAPTAKSKSGGLSTGAKAGIGAACGIVGIVLIIAVIMFFVRRGRKEPATPMAEASGAPDRFGGGFVAPQGHATYYDPPKPQVQQNPQEMYSGEERHELYGA